MPEQKGIYAVLNNNLSLLEGLEFTPPSSARTKGDDTRYYVYTYLVRIQHFLFDFPFDEIYRRLFFFTLTRYVCATPVMYTTCGGVQKGSVNALC